MKTSAIIYLNTDRGTEKYPLKSHQIKREERDLNAGRKIFSIMNRRLTTEMTVRELLDQNPKLLQAFLDLGLLCVGCPTEAFHTVEDIAKEYGYDPNKLIEHFEGIINATELSKALKL